MGAHPEITSLIRLKDEAREQLRKEQWRDLVKTLWCWNIELKESDRDNDLITLIEKEEKTLQSFKYDGGVKDRTKKMKYKYREWYDKTMKNTYEKGYFSNEKYKFEMTEDAVKFGS